MIHFSVQKNLIQHYVNYVSMKYIFLKKEWALILIECNESSMSTPFSVCVPSSFSVSHLLNGNYTASLIG